MADLVGAREAFDALRRDVLVRFSPGSPGLRNIRQALDDCLSLLGPILAGKRAASPDPGPSALPLPPPRPAAEAEGLQPAPDPGGPPRVRLTYEVDDGRGLRPRELPFVIGVLAGAVAIGILLQAAWGQVTGLIVAGLMILTNFAFLPHYPFWSLTIIAFSVLVMWALCTQLRRGDG